MDKGGRAVAETTRTKPLNMFELMVIYDLVSGPLVKISDIASPCPPGLFNSSSAILSLPVPLRPSHSLLLHYINPVSKNSIFLPHLTLFIQYSHMATCIYGRAYFAETSFFMKAYTVVDRCQEEYSYMGRMGKIQWNSTNKFN